MNQNAKKQIILIALMFFSFLGNIFGQTYLTDKNYPLKKENEVKFYNMTEEEIKEYETDLWRRIADLALIPPKINTKPSSKYDADQQKYVMALTNEITLKGRHWVAWIGNEDAPKAILLAAKSDDDGKTWSKPCLVIDAQIPYFPVGRTVIIGNFWTDPSGRLWLFFDQTMDHHDGRGGIWVTICDDPDADDPVWSAPKRIWHGAMLNKPTVLSSGEWLLCAYLLQLVPNQNNNFWHRTEFSELDSFRGVNLLVSKDQGNTWELRSVQKFPNPDWSEPMVVEKQNGQLWMLTRTRTGVMETFSADRGYTWTEPVPSQNFKHPNSRFFFRKLASGRILLIKNGDKLDELTTIRIYGGRDQLSAWLSEDNGQTWKGGLIIDDRPRVTYPDGTQGKDGTIYVTYDHNRGDGEIVMAKFTEEDVLAGKIVNPHSQLEIVVCKPGKK